MPSFSSSSLAIRSSPHVRFAATISPISRCRSGGIRGRPRGRDCRRQNNRKPLRCQRTSVSGFTTVRTRRHSISRDKATSTIRVASSARRGFAWRSMYNASCFRRNKFSAASWACDRTAVEANRTTSPMIRRMVHAAVRDRDRLIIAASVREQRTRQLGQRVKRRTFTHRPIAAEIVPARIFCG